MILACSQLSNFSFPGDVDGEGLQASLPVLNFGVFYNFL